MHILGAMSYRKEFPAKLFRGLHHVNGSQTIENRDVIIECSTCNKNSAWFAEHILVLTFTKIKISS
jgi:hypothetical protein